MKSTVVKKLRNYKVTNKIKNYKRIEKKRGYLVKKLKENSNVVFFLNIIRTFLTKRKLYYLKVTKNVDYKLTVAKAI